ncbi:MAG: EthD family reductase [Pseudomonadales bacterium]|nr:EthD family reductase [Pseudomonadales bacterium]
MSDRQQKFNKRRSVLTGAARVATAGIATALVGVGGSRVRAAESQVDQECLTIVYQNGDDIHFDFDYYRSIQMPLIMRLYGDSISRFELRRGLPAANGAKARYIATATIWIADPAAFDRAAAEHQAGISADVPKFTNAQPIAQRDRIVGIA